MIFIIDAHLPRVICTYFKNQGHQAIHTLELPEKNLTDDTEIAQIAFEKGAIVISKDSDFYHSFLLHRKPPKLVLVKVGNMRLPELRNLFEQEALKIAELMKVHSLIEVHQNQILVLE
jgi:predicted nuclease of predicted toxin-antitoxin system